MTKVCQEALDSIKKKPSPAMDYAQDSLTFLDFSSHAKKWKTFGQSIKHIIFSVNDTLVFKRSMLSDSQVRS